MVEFSSSLYACYSAEKYSLDSRDCKHPEIWAVGGVLLGVILANLCSEGWHQVIQSAGTSRIDGLPCGCCDAREARHHGAQNAV